MAACALTTASSGESETELDSVGFDERESAVTSLVRATCFATRVHLNAALCVGTLTKRLAKMRCATRAADLLVEHGTTETNVLVSALLSGTLDYGTTRPCDLENEFGAFVLLIVAQTAKVANSLPGEQLRAYASNAVVIMPIAARVLAALLSADFLLMLEQRPAYVSFRRIRYHALWLRVMLHKLAYASVSLKRKMLVQLNGSVIWNGAPRTLRLNALCNLHGTAQRALDDYYMALDRQWPLNDTPSNSDTETSSFASDSSRLRSGSGTSTPGSVPDINLRSKSMSPLARSRRPRRTRTDSAP